MAKSRVTPWTHTGILTNELTTTCEGRPVVVPAGTVCRKLDGGSNPWVVGDLSFIADKESLLYFDADHHGIRVPEEKLQDIYPVGITRTQMAEKLATLRPEKKEKISLAIRQGADTVDRGSDNSTVAFLRGAQVDGKKELVVLGDLVEIAYAEAEIRKAQERSGDVGQDMEVVSELINAVDTLKAVNEKFKAGQLSPLEHGRQRGAAIAKALVNMAADCGVKLQQPVGIDSNGEFSIVVEQVRGREWGNDVLGKLFAEILNQHNPRTGVAPGAIMLPENCWCRMNHFEVEKMVVSYVENGLFHHGKATDNFKLFANVPVVNEGQYSGKIVGITGQLAVQDIGRGRYVAHDASNWKIEPAVDTVVEVKYVDQKAEVKIGEQEKNSVER